MSDQKNQELYQTMLSDLQEGECVTINEKDEIFFCRKFLGRIGKDFESEKQAFKGIKDAMERVKYWPNIYRVNDHGNVSLLDGKGNEIAAWV